MDDQPQEEGDFAKQTGLGCAYVVLLILVLAALFFAPAVVSVGELAEKHRQETQEQR